MKAIDKRQDEIIQEFSMYEDWMEKYERIIEMGKEMPPLDEALKTDDKLIKGCQSRVWLHAAMQDGKVVFKADSDAIITKGLVALMIEILSDASPQDIANADLYFIDKIGLAAHLSPTRSNGLLSMVKQMKMYGQALASLEGYNKQAT